MREITNWTASQPAERQELYKMKTGRHSSKKWMGSGQVTFFLWPSVSLIVKWRSWSIKGPVRFSLLSLWFSVDLKVAIFNTCLLFRWMKSRWIQNTSYTLIEANSAFFVLELKSSYRKNLFPWSSFCRLSFVLWSFLLGGHSYHGVCLTMRTWVIEELC